MELRDYQRRGIEAVIKAWEEGRVPLISVATGGGKSFMIATLLSRILPINARALVIAHTEEIVNQLYTTTLNTCTSKTSIGIVMAEKNDAAHQIIIATRQSLITRLENLLKHGSFFIVVVDEAHHATTKNSYGQLLYNLFKSNSQTKVVGFTATPQNRNGALFSDIVFSWNIEDGINEGFLVPFIVVNFTSNNGIGEIQAYKKHILPTNRQCIAFFPSVDTSRDFAKAMKLNNISAAHIDGRTPKDERRDILSKYKEGIIRLLCNMQVFTEGFDAPNTSAILLARKVKSKILLTQIIGRGLRYSPSKHNCLILNLSEDIII